MKIARFIFNPIEENTYVLSDDGGKAAIIDAGNSTPGELEKLDEYIRKNSLTPVVAVNTHGHFDHIMGVKAVCEKYSIPFACSSKDDYLLGSAASSAAMFGVSAQGFVTGAQIDLDSVLKVQVGSIELEVIKTPGHTPGGVCLWDREHKILFSGDTLFRECIGRTDLPGGDYRELMRSLLDRVIGLGDETEVYPGHGEKSTIGHESLYNPFITEVLQEQVKF